MLNTVSSDYANIQLKEGIGEEIREQAKGKLLLTKVSVIKHRIYMKAVQNVHRQTKCILPMSYRSQCE